MQHVICKWRFNNRVECRKDILLFSDLQEVIQTFLSANILDLFLEHPCQQVFKFIIIVQFNSYY